MIEKGWGNSLNAIMGWKGPITHRQVIAFCAWQIVALNYPDRNDYYQMMVACVTARANAKHPQSIQPSQFKMSFGGSDSPISREERNRRSKEVMDARIASRGGLSRFTIVDINGNVLRPALAPATVSTNPLVRPPSPEEVAAFREKRQQLVASKGGVNAIDSGTGNVSNKANGRRNRSDSLPRTSGPSTPTDGG